MTREASIAAKRCVIIADDLTGACDSALQFRRHGARARVHLALDADARDLSDVDAFSTDTRNLPECEAATRIRQVGTHIMHLDSGAAVVFKKIDSLLRGTPGSEIMATMDVFACEVGVITPAFPEMGRTVSEGHLHVHGDDDWKPIDVLGTLRSQGLEECNHVAPGLIAKSLAQGCRYVSVDSASNEDLRIIADETIGCGRKVLWVGSAGLAGALAGLLFPGGVRAVGYPKGKRPILFCIGSQHAVTAGQLGNLRRDRTVCELNASTANKNDIAAALARGEHTILRIEVGETLMRQLRALLSGIGGLAEAILISGGDTVSLICDAVESRTIEIEDQVVAGLPWGILRGGLLDGLPVATKSGAFGGPDALTKVTDFFTCSRN